eukprot:g20401.t1
MVKEHGFMIYYRFFTPGRISYFSGRKIEMVIDRESRLHYHFCFFGYPKRSVGHYNAFCNSVARVVLYWFESTIISMWCVAVLWLLGMTCAHEVTPELEKSLNDKLKEMEEAYKGLDTKCDKELSGYVRGDLFLDDLLDCMLEKGKQYAENMHKFGTHLDMRHSKWSPEKCHYTVPLLLKLLEIGFPYYGSIVDLGGPGPYPRHNRGPEESFMAAVNTFSNSLSYMFNDYTCNHHLDLLRLGRDLDRAWEKHVKSVVLRPLDLTEAMVEDMQAHTPFMDLQDTCEEAIREYGRKTYLPLLDDPDFYDWPIEKRQNITDSFAMYNHRRKGVLSFQEGNELVRWKNLFVQIQPALFRIWKEQGGYKYIHDMYHVRHHHEL